MFKYYYVFITTFKQHPYNRLTTDLQQTTMKEKYDENKVKIAFSNVKEDILELKREMELIKSELSEIKHKIGFKNEGSKGSKGVLTTDLQQTYNRLTTDLQENALENLDKNLKNLDEDIKKFILLLTDKEFLVFTLIYQQEDELKRPISYEEIGKKLKMSQDHLRGCIRNLVFKEAPIIKQKSNNKMFLSIKKEFRNLKIGAKIINFRRSFTGQTNLSDNFGI